MDISDALFAKTMQGLVQGMKRAADLVAFQAFVEENMEQGTRPETARNEGTRLYKGKGKLSRAFIKGKPGNILDVVAGPNGAEITFGIDTEVIPYALIHEFGGEIPITDKMRRFFWAKYAETKQQFWMAMALTKKSSITMPARPYFYPAVEAYEAEGMQEFLDSIYESAQRAFNA